MSRPFTVLVVFMFISATLWPQTSGQSEISTEDPFSLIGLKVNELIEHYGPPQTVYTSRGQEAWQDDVVFTYSEGDFYIYKDRVWQVGIRSACGISIGDSKPAVTLALGEQAVDQGDYFLMPLPAAGWPMMLRVNFNSMGRVSAIFIFRSDY